jgi:hypothetical protein
LEILSDRRKVCAALFIRDLLCERIESAYLLALLSFENTPNSRRRNAKLMVFFHRCDYGKFEPLNKAIMVFNEYCGEFAFQSDTSREVFRGRFRRWLFSERMRPSISNGQRRERRCSISNGQRREKKRDKLLLANKFLDLFKMPDFF